MVRDGRAVDVGQLTDFLHRLVGTGHRAGQGAADADVILARSLLAETWVKRNDL